MEELVHRDCGGEIYIISVYKWDIDEVVEFRCAKCGKEFRYEQWG